VLVLIQALQSLGRGHDGVHGAGKQANAHIKTRERTPEFDGAAEKTNAKPHASKASNGGDVSDIEILYAFLPVCREKG